MPTKPTAPDTPPAPEVAARSPVVGEAIWYRPPEHHARHVPGPWAAVFLGHGEGDLAILAAMPPRPVPIGTDPVVRVDRVKYSEKPEPGTWGWPVH